ncbi:hypothetical protein C0J52_25517 [Blattella germanica]|nr:hypothetical protein C0J52_25517 [Blattella germanica]
MHHDKASCHTSLTERGLGHREKFQCLVKSLLLFKTQKTPRKMSSTKLTGTDLRGKRNLGT